MWPLVIRSLFLQATWLSNCTTRRFCNVCSTKNIQNNGRSRTAYFTTLMCWCSQCSNFCHSNHAWIFQHTFFKQFSPLFLRMNTATRVSFSRFPCNSGTIEWKQQQGCNIHDISVIQEQSVTVIHVIAKTRFQRCFHYWQTPWSHSINSEERNKQKKGWHIFCYWLGLDLMDMPH